MALKKPTRRGTVLAGTPNGGKNKKPNAKTEGRADSSAEAKPVATKKYCASVFCWPQTLPIEFVEKVTELEQVLGQDVWLMIQGGQLDDRIAGRIDFQMLDAFTELKTQLPKPERPPEGGPKKPRMALLIHSGGGFGEPAYRIASLLKRQCRGFTAVIPRLAKSAATLLALGADTIILGEDAELGPLDAQFFDYDVAEQWVSALDEVQAVEALEQSALETAMSVMVYLKERTKKSYNVLMPHAMHFAAEITKPLFEKIDSVRYSRQSRRLQETQDYAEKLLRPRFTADEAKAIARDLVRNYPTHEFVIDRQEAKQVGKMEDRHPVGLHIDEPNASISKLLDWFYGNVTRIRAIGRVQEVEQ
jgi:hypothetical protein